MLLIVLQFMVAAAFIALVLLKRQLDAQRDNFQTREATASARLADLERELDEVRIALGLPPREPAHQWIKRDVADRLLD